MLVAAEINIGSWYGATEVTRHQPGSQRTESLRCANCRGRSCVRDDRGAVRTLLEFDPTERRTTQAP
jgi:hypothetical protein